MEQKVILDKEQINHIIKRIAYQIWETFVDEKEIVIAGIANSGYFLRKKSPKK